MDDTPAILLLEDGKIYRGTAVGMRGTIMGELTFYTGMSGFQEILSDPALRGKILLTTNSYTGNCGITAEEMKALHIHVSGLAAWNVSDHYACYNATLDFVKYLLEKEIVGIAGLDTRAIVRYIRLRGPMKAAISSEIDRVDELKNRLKAFRENGIEEIAPKVSTPAQYYLGDEDAAHRIAVIDYGIKTKVLSLLLERDCYISVFPPTTRYSDIKKWRPERIFLSNGPGNPGKMKERIKEIKKMISDDQIVFGSGLGGLLIGESLNIPSRKTLSSSIGSNYPVKNLRSGRCEMTLRTQGYELSMDISDSVKDKVETTHICLNDNSVVGFRHREMKVFSILFQPESSPGPRDAVSLFDEFINL